ncbi:MAG: tetratricopeptide repeat protein [Hormoscilla sp. GM7CHS1pb]|nr:tetratricopeptide repeat protein [Hormoscilla sp. GM7CHS1pb]
MTAQEVLDLNKQIYKRLEAALSLNLLSQIFLAVCDDCSLRNQIANQLTEAKFARDQTGDGSTRSYPLLVSLKLNVKDPNPVSEIAHWLGQHPNQGRSIALGFQILGVEQLTRQPSRIQRQFLNYLQMIGQSWPLPLELTLLLWMPRPWLLSIQQSAPDFWRCRTGIFEFVSEPTPVLADSWPGEDADALSSKTPFTASLPEQGLKSLLRTKSVETEDADALSSKTPFTASLPEQGLKSLLRTKSVETEDADALSSKTPFTASSLEQGLKSLLRTETEELIDAFSRGNLYRDIIHQGEATAENLIEAIIAYEQAIEYLEEDSHLWAYILNDLGNLYWMRSRHISVREQAIAYLEQGIKAYEIALSHILQYDRLESAGHDGKTYRRLQNNLGAAYSELARYVAPVKNLQESIIYYTEALDYSQELSDGKQYAATLNNLGTAYWNLAQHQQPVANLQQAIGAYSEALSYSSPSQEPLNYGMIQNNLGTTYWNLAVCLSEPEEYLQMAISAYKIALEYRTASAAPAAHAATQNNLGMAYWHLANQEGISGPLRVEFLSKCISAYQQALETALLGQLTDLSFDLLATHNNLGLAYYQKATQTDSIEVEHKLHDLEAALEHHLQGLVRMGKSARTVWVRL